MYRHIRSAISKRIVDSRITGNHASAAMLLTFFVISFYGVRKFFDVTSGLPPTHLLLSICFVPWPLAKEGVASIAYEISLLLITIVVTRLVAELTYRLVEQPFVHLGKRVISAGFERSA